MTCVQAVVIVGVISLSTVMNWDVLDATVRRVFKVRHHQRYSLSLSEHCVTLRWIGPNALETYLLHITKILDIALSSDEL